MQLLEGLPELLNACACLKTLKFGTEQTLKRAKRLCLSREACGNGQCLANCLQLCSGISPLYASKVRHFRILTNSTNVGLALKFVTLSSPHHISQNCFFSKAFKKKKKRPGAIQKIFSWLLGANNICSRTSVFFPSYFFYIIVKRKEVEWNVSPQRHKSIILPVDYIWDTKY